MSIEFLGESNYPICDFECWRCAWEWCQGDHEEVDYNEGEVCPECGAIQALDPWAEEPLEEY